MLALFRKTLPLILAISVGRNAPLAMTSTLHHRFGQVQGAREIVECPRRNNAHLMGTFASPAATPLMCRPHQRRQ